MDKKPKKKLLSKWVRIGVEGATCDRRNLERQWLEQMAAAYDPKVYGARINLEHLKGILPDGPFQRYGDVAMLKTEEIAEEGLLKGKLALYARLVPTDQLIEMNRKGQKVYSSIEVDPKFADTGKAYLVGLAVTDDPASLGTEMLSFCAGAQSNPLASRKRSPDNVFSVAIETELEFEEVEERGGETLFTRIRALLSKKQNRDDQQMADVHQAVEEVASFCGEQVDQIRSELTELQMQHQQLQTDYSALKTLLAKQPATLPRQPATGGGTDLKTDC
ncbi:capsid scaffolding protein [Edwardsiella ictaluri]|uniref:Phage capsid scaffolding protein GpO n=2 Tax=Edwardsiella ictaluri TaxID=67780 RepID=C5BAR2_EDWI9|nr:GPO family capsid scaffolding protein [Edwardsiella ictaluri]ACR70269.1 phage capsid scaffolding protein GpO [Edwardsiella ictaluri 93-146]AVZ82864.1 capsid scaffolding protein [Edwardsiella ictaluri]EKS7762468.1 GPO family capsid scaffolding protein [Edwardsiella ictaluri]EKS7770418.1 GPO family capsid scaffolding protein [Edwardsiella ictaluri]EKS7773560.1 GPO family capsid scaffolding protein [Edwardsiella ictaluri]